MDYCTKRPVLGSLAALAGLLAACLLNHWLFSEIFEADYLRWYANAGPFIALATAAFGAAWGGLDKNVALISAQPCEYLRASLQAAGLPIYVFGTHFRRQHGAHVAGELFAAIPLVLAFVAAALGWLLFIVPVQYFVYLVCGAPVRIALSSRVRIEAHRDGRRVELDERARDEPLRGGWWDASMRDNPVTLTSAFSAALLFLIDQALKYCAS